MLDLTDSTHPHAVVLLEYDPGEREDNQDYAGDEKIQTD